MENSMTRRRRRIKIISMGDATVGKSCLIKRYCESKFVSSYLTTVGVDYGVKNVTVGTALAKVNLFDFSGLKEFCEVRKEFYKDTQGALLVYDVGNKSSLEALDMWLDEAKRSGTPKNCAFLVLGNKIDANKMREVSKAEGEKWAEKRKIRHFEVSAKTGKNVKEAFSHLFRSVLEDVVGGVGRRAREAETRRGGTQRGRGGASEKKKRRRGRK